MSLIVRIFATCLLICSGPLNSSAEVQSFPNRIIGC
jgi:hypothetical protein